MAMVEAQAPGGQAGI